MHEAGRPAVRLVLWDFSPGVRTYPLNTPSLCLGNCRQHSKNLATGVSSHLRQSPFITPVDLLKMLRAYSPPSKSLVEMILAVARLRRPNFTSCSKEPRPQIPRTDSVKDINICNFVHRVPTNY